jgi:septum formation protein
MPPSLLLASGSPRRAELLRAAGIPFDVQITDVDESVWPGEKAEAYVLRLALAKAAAISAAGRPVLAADTVVVVDDRLLGKPRDADEARQMLRALSARTHEVLTGVCLLVGTAEGPRQWTHVERTFVEFAPLSSADVDWYVASGEPFDKAGAYAIQGLASRFVTRIDGSYSNVVGLPVAAVYRLCTEAGLLVS